MATRSGCHGRDMPCESGFGPEQSKRATGHEVGPKIEGVPVRTGWLSARADTETKDPSAAYDAFSYSRKRLQGGTRTRALSHSNSGRVATINKLFESATT